MTLTESIDAAIRSIRQEGLELTPTARALLEQVRTGDLTLAEYEVVIIFEKHRERMNDVAAIRKILADTPLDTVRQAITKFCGDDRTKYLLSAAGQQTQSGND
jgi:hypothetical protein